jgi:hypothetical protein
MPGVTHIAPVEGETSILNEGARGPAGVGAFTHTQAVAATEWIINHNRGARPIVQAFTPGGDEVECRVLHVSDNQARLYFAAPQAGSARCI